MATMHTDPFSFDYLTIQKWTSRCSHEISQAELHAIKLEELNKKLNKSRRERIGLVNDLILYPDDPEIRRNFFIKTLETEELIEDRRRVMSKLSKYFNNAVEIIALLAKESIYSDENSYLTSLTAWLIKLDVLASNIKRSEVSGIQTNLLIEVLMRLESIKSNFKFSTLKFRLKKILDTLL